MKNLLLLTLLSATALHAGQVNAKGMALTGMEAPAAANPANATFSTEITQFITQSAKAILDDLKKDPKWLVITKNSLSLSNDSHVEVFTVKTKQELKLGYETKHGGNGMLEKILNQIRVPITPGLQAEIAKHGDGIVENAAIGKAIVQEMMKRFDGERAYDAKYKYYQR